uniref:Uncharacterized protein n=1 Tax=Oryza meridionalis TaxID=40149 RepID=A0A0E0DF83_9ORYZ
MASALPCAKPPTAKRRKGYRLRGERTTARRDEEQTSARAQDTDTDVYVERWASGPRDSSSPMLGVSGRRGTGPPGTAYATEEACAV